VGANDEQVLLGDRDVSATREQVEAKDNIGGGLIHNVEEGVSDLPVADLALEAYATTMRDAHAVPLDELHVALYPLEVEVTEDGAEDVGSNARGRASVDQRAGYTLAVELDRDDAVS
jgi:hypothetical protein